MKKRLHTSAGRRNARWTGGACGAARRRLLSGLTALLLALALVPADAAAAGAETAGNQVRTLAELEAYIAKFKAGQVSENYVSYVGSTALNINRDITFPDGLSFYDAFGKDGSVMIQNNAHVTMEGAYAHFRTNGLQIESGASFSGSSLECYGQVYIDGTVTVKDDITCFNGLELRRGGVINLGRRLTLRDLQDQTRRVILNGTINFTNEEDTLNHIAFGYHAYSLDTLSQYLGKAAADTGEHHKYDIYLHLSKPLSVNSLTIPANTILRVNSMENSTGAVLTVAAGGRVSNAGFLSVSSEIRVDGTMDNETGGQIDICKEGSLTVEGSLNNRGYIGVSGNLWVNGSLFNDRSRLGEDGQYHPVNISVNRMNRDFEEGVLTLGPNGTYSGYGDINCSCPETERYTDFIIGFGELLSRFMREQTAMEASMCSYPLKKNMFLPLQRYPQLF